eukprot:TRINITY_DN1360_c0_g1_i1.p1 TRINITY_DN1360_c0_g1~~TRINITY_DN1360_c0_g1_i1.p1  ORF type:complete len:227 (-),score=58.11 TRINITY_DN1360_c0_g1_i1:114-794(-)
MGTIFSKKEKSRITEQDKAILALKKQRDQLKQYQKRINNNLEKDRELAKKLLQEGKKDRAKLLLRKKKYQEGLLDQTDKQLDQLEKLTQDLEFTQVEKQVIDGLKVGNDALQRANSIFSVEEIEDLMLETQEAVDKQREIDTLISGQLSESDEDDVLKELDALLLEEPELPNVPADKLEPELPNVPADKLPSQPITDDMLPDVPTSDLPQVEKSDGGAKKIAVAAS